jgi:hypothetical protein
MPRISSLLGLVPLLGLAELALHRYYAERAPDAAQYAALGSQLSKLKRAGVPVVVAPAWAEPLVRQAAPDAFPQNELARADDRSFAAFLEVSLLGQTAPTLDTFPIRREDAVGPFRVRLRENPRPEPTRFDFVAAVDAGRVEVFTELDDQRQACDWAEQSRSETGGLHGHVAYPRRRHVCARGRVVGVTIIEDQDYHPRRCVLAQVPDDGSVVLRFAEVPSSTRLLGYVGASYFLERGVTTPQVELSVGVGGEPLLREAASGARGWSRFELARPAESSVVEVRLRRLARQSGDFCFSLEAR